VRAARGAAGPGTAASGIPGRCPARAADVSRGRSGSPGGLRLDPAVFRIGMTPVFLDLFVPDGDEARRWAEEELANPRYAEAKPTWFDLLARDIGRFFFDLFTADAAGNAGPAALIVVSIVIIAALITALIVWGRPRRSRAI